MLSLMILPGELNRLRVTDEDDVPSHYPSAHVSEQVRVVFAGIDFLHIASTL